MERREVQAAEELNAWWQSLIVKLNVTKADIWANLNNESWWELQNDALVELLRRLILDVAEMGTAMAERQLRLHGMWSYVNPRVQTWATDHAGELVTALMPELRAIIHETISQAMSVGESWPAIRERLSEGLPRWRAERIARTEVIRAGTQGAIESYRASGTVRGVRWLDNQAGACEDCHALHGQLRRLGDVFYQSTFGDGLPPRHPHCRCAVAPVTLSEVARLPESHPLRDNRRANLNELMDKETFVDLPGKLGPVRVTGEQAWNWRYQQGNDVARMEALLPQLLQQPEIIKRHRGIVYVMPWNENTYLIASVVRGNLRSLYVRSRRQVDRWPGR